MEMKSVKTLKKLTIAKIDGANEDGTFSLAARIFECQFNPTEFQVGKVNNWNVDSSIGANSESLTFLGGAAQDVSLKLLFDNTGNGKPVTDDSNYKLLKSFTLTETGRKNEHTGKSEPPRVHVQWGEYISFPAVITEFVERFMLFTPEGAPVRIEVSLTLKQAIDTSKQNPQNPTSRSIPYKTHRVQMGERLDWIAFQAYGDAAAWKEIALANEIVDPLTLTPGQLLRIPEQIPSSLLQRK